MRTTGKNLTVPESLRMARLFLRECPSWPQFAIGIHRSAFGRYEVMGQQAARKLFGRRIGVMHFSFPKCPDRRGTVDVYTAIRSAARDILWSLL